MKTFMRQSAIACVALILAAGLGAGSEWQGCRVAEAQLGANWDISIVDDSYTSSGPGGTSRNQSTKSEQKSDDGQESEDKQSRQENEDGSSSEQEEYRYDDGKCNKSGGWSRHTTRDKDGNRTVRYEHVWRENGRCEIVIETSKFDKNGKPIGEPEIKKSPCSEYRLEWHREGLFAAGPQATRYGPDTMVIALARAGSVLTGTHYGQWRGEISGMCHGTLILPISVEVTAREDEFADLDFAVTATSYQTGFMVCPQGGGGSMNTQPVTFTRTFHLPAQDGASKDFSFPVQTGQTTDLFTLRKPCE